MAKFIVTRELTQFIEVEAETFSEAVEQAAFVVDSEWTTTDEGEYEAVELP